MNLKQGGDLIGSVNSTDNLHFNFNEDAVKDDLDSPIQDIESPTVDQEYRSHSSEEEDTSPMQVGMDPVEIHETDDFPSEGISLRRRNSAGKGLQLDTDLEIDDNPYTKRVPQTPMVKMRDPMNDLNEMNYLKRDPEEEFFMLAVLALKMVHNEEYDEAEYVYEISAGKLFRQVRTQNMPFHRWYKWLEDKFASLRDGFLKEAESKKTDADRWQVEADKLLEHSNKKLQPKKKGLLGKIK